MPNESPQVILINIIPAVNGIILAVIQVARYFWPFRKNLLHSIERRISLLKLDPSASGIPRVLEKRVIVLTNTLFILGLVCLVSFLDIQKESDVQPIDLTNRSIMIREFFDINDPNRRGYNYVFTVSRSCQLIINYDRAMGFRVQYGLMAPHLGIMRFSFYGTNIPPDRVDLVPGNYLFTIFAHRGAGQHWVSLEALCR